MGGRSDILKIARVFRQTVAYGLKMDRMAAEIASVCRQTVEPYGLGVFRIVLGWGLRRPGRYG